MGSFGVPGDAPSPARQLSGPVYQFYHTAWTELERALPAVAAAGYDAIQVPPAQRSKRGWDDPQPRGYQPIDHLDFDGVFGTETQYRSMVETAHEHGLAVVADAVLNHMAADVNFEAFPQFGWDDFRHEGPIRDDEDDWELENRDLEGLPDLRQESAHVRDVLEQYVETYARLGVDGLRWDAVKHMPAWFFRDYANRWAHERGLFVVGEVLHGGVDYCLEYLDTGMAVMDYPLYFTMREDAFHEDGDLRTLVDAGVVADHPDQSLTFVSNHDSPPPEYERLAYAFVLTYSGYPRVYSGRIGPDDDTVETLLDVRSRFASGPVRIRHAGTETLVFEREGSLLVGLNRATSARTVTVETPWHGHPLHDHGGDGDPVTTGPDGTVTLSIPPVGWVCYVP